MNDKVSEVIARQDEFSAEFGETRSEEVENTDGQAVPVTSNSEKWALAHGISALFELAASHEKRIAELETRLNGLLGLGGGLDTALAKRDARIEALEAAASTKAREAYLRTIDPMQTYVPPDTPQELAALVEAASKATSEPALEAQLAPVDPAQNWSGMARVIVTDSTDGFVTLKNLGLAYFLQRHTGKTVNLVVYPAENEAQPEASAPAQPTPTAEKQEADAKAAPVNPPAGVNPLVYRLEAALIRVEQLLGGISVGSRAVVWTAIMEARIVAYQALEDVSRDEAKDALGILPF